MNQETATKTARARVKLVALPLAEAWAAYRVGNVVEDSLHEGAVQGCADVKSRDDAAIARGQRTKSRVACRRWIELVWLEFGRVDSV
jgi:hypothetical protein